MKTLVIGLGVQGVKRKLHAGSDYVASVDPYNIEADYTDVKDVPLGDFDAAMCCIPDTPKYEIVKYLLENKKDVLVEKPLWVDKPEKLEELQILAKKSDAVCYTAYNHRFEPHFVQVKKILQSNRLGHIYTCRMFYGNGTARLVRNSIWRDQGAGVLPDLSSHLLDTIDFWFSERNDNYHVHSVSCFENKSPDHVLLSNETTLPKILLEMTLLQWRNHFTCDILAEHGSLHLRSLCKWGPCTLTERTRVLPSGKPLEHTISLSQDDPTWALEYQNFKDQCVKRAPTNLTKDIWLGRIIENLSNEAELLRGN